MRTHQAVIDNWDKTYGEIAEITGYSPEYVRKLGKKLGLSHKKVNSQAKKREGQDAVQSIVKFLSRGRKESELEEFGISVDDLSVPGYELYQTRNHYQEMIYLLLPKVEPVNLKPKIWTHQWQPDGEPYLWIQLPKRKWKKIKVVPLADLHYGAKPHLWEKFREYVNWIATTDHVFAFINGDVFENSHGDSNRGMSMYEQEIRPKDQVSQMAEILGPIAHKILWAVPGNHEDRSRTRDYDPLERLCEKLGIPYSYEPVFVDLLWSGYAFTFYAQHGRTGSLTKGGKMNAAMRPLKMQEHVMFTVMAHVHDGDVTRNTRVCRNRNQFRLDLRKQYTIICPSFFGYFGSYASKAGYEPGSYGAIACEIFPNGDYHARA